MRFVVFVATIVLAASMAKANETEIKLTNTMVMLLAETVSDAEDCGLGGHPATHQAIVATRNMLVARRRLLSLEQLEGRIIEEIADYRRRKQTRHCDSISSQHTLEMLHRIRSLAQN
ncbi:MAG: hypothetical protein FD152_2310 [Xanthobacteraceae bacterium]|nr:MAG: hypothetical protein FD152_2310 [Xanthobacteraceae bacterium]